MLRSLRRPHETLPTHHRRSRATGTAPNLHGTSNATTGNGRVVMMLRFGRHAPLGCCRVVDAIHQGPKPCRRCSHPFCVRLTAVNIQASTRQCLAIGLVTKMPEPTGRPRAGSSAVRLSSSESRGTFHEVKPVTMKCSFSSPVTSPKHVQRLQCTETL